MRLATIPAIVTIGFFALAPVEAGAQSGTLTGTVTARQTGQPVADAVITVDGTTTIAVSNVVGRFRIEPAPPAGATLIVQAPGFLELRVPAAPSLRIELEPTPNFMERVQVTATKSELSVGDVAAQTTTVERQDMDLRGAQSLPQAVAHVPGAVVSTQLGIFDSVMLRGMPRGDPEFTNTLLLVDGVPQTLSNNGARIVALPINDASSIEIVRGPNSALYGRTAIGGSINVLTADPTAEPELRLDLTGGEFEMFKGIARVSGPIATWGGYYASFAKEANHGYFVNRTSSDFSVGNTSFFGKVSFAPGSRASGNISIGRVVSSNSTPTNEPIIDGRLLHEIDPRFDRFTNFNIPGPNYKQTETRFTFNYNRQLTDSLRMYEVFGYRDVVHGFIDDGDFIGSPYDLDAHTLTMYPFSQKMTERIFYQEFRVELAPKAPRMRNSLVAGASYERNNGTLASDFIYNDEDLFGFSINYLNPVIPPRSEWQHDIGRRIYHLGVTGLFAHYSIEPTSRVILAAGGRYDRLDRDNARNGGAMIEDSFDAFSPKASATVKLLDAARDNGTALSLYGAYSQSFLPPRRPSSLVPAEVPLNLKPEDIANYEGGIKGSTANGRVSFEATYFRMTEDGVVLSTRQGPFFFPTNAGKLRYKGVETGVTVSMSPKVGAYVNASFYRNRFGDFVIESEDGDTALTGNRLPISPDHVVNWGATFTPIPAINANVDIKHVGAVQVNRDNTFLLNAFSVVDAAVSWQRGPRIRVTVAAHNLLNEAYYWNGDGETADPARPRQVIVTTSLLFR
jgi:outer membrane receptor protein involved in Fe transport